MKRKVLAVASILSFFMLSWWLDAKLQPSHCINSSIIKFAVNYKFQPETVYTKRDGHHKSMDSVLVPSCDYNEYFKFKNNSDEKAFGKIMARIEQLEDLVQTLPKVKSPIEVIVRSDQAYNVVATPSRVEISGDLILKEHILERAILTSWVEQSYLTMPNSFQSILVDFLYSTLQGDLVVGEASGQQLTSELLTVGKSSKSYCQSKLVSIHHYQTCRLLISEGENLSLANIDKTMRLSPHRTPIVKDLWFYYTNADLSKKLNMLSQLKEESFIKPFLQTMSSIPNSSKQWLKIHYETLSEAFEIDSDIKSVNDNLILVSNETWNAERLNISSNPFVGSGFEVSNSEDLSRQGDGNTQGAKIAVLLKCGELSLAEVLEYKGRSKRLLHIKNCKNFEKINWTPLLRDKNVESFFSANTHLKFKYYHIPSVELATKYGKWDVNPEVTLGWQSVYWDDKLQAHIPRAIFDGITHYRN